MAEYKLKPGQEKFQVVDGTHAGRKYQPGRVYAEIPPNEAGRFEKVTPVIDAVVAPKKTKKADEAEK